jgi:antitoxin HicB
MRGFTYPASLKREVKGLTVTFRDLPEAIAHGVNRSDALLHAADCLDEAIANRIITGLTIPVPSRASRTEDLVAVPALMAAKAALHLAIRESGLSKSRLARRLQCDAKEIRRMLGPRHATKLTRIETALAVLGKRLILSVSEAA